MKIEDTKPGTTAITSPNAQVRPAVRQETAFKPSDKVSISAETRALAASADAPFDSARVDEIRAAIAAGSFKVNPDKIADGMIASVREQLGARQ